MIRLETKNYNKILTEAAKISALSSGKINRYECLINRYECLTGEQILPPGQSRMIEQAIYTYFPLEKALEKQKKNNCRPWKATN